MLEKPDLPDRRIIARVQAAYQLRLARLDFLPLGADVNTAVYRLVACDRVAGDGTAYFLKLRKGNFDEITVTLPKFLNAQGIAAVICPLETCHRQLWTGLDDFKLVLYPFIEGRNGYEVALTDDRWREFGATLRAIHSAQLPPGLARRIPREGYAPRWRRMVMDFQARVEATAFADPVAAQVKTLMQDRRAEISRLVQRADELAQALQSRPVEFVLCHSDIHAGNLLIPVDPESPLYIVDWDNPIYAPKEHDLMHVGGSSLWNHPRQAALFYQGYGATELDYPALAYYRYERIIQDIAAYCEQLLLTDAGGEDREQSLHYFSGQFLPGYELDIAFQTDKIGARVNTDNTDLD